MKNLLPATPTVLAVDAMPRPRTWSQVPTGWYQHIRRPRADARGRDGEPQSYSNPLACIILDDILQFYRSVEINHNGRLMRCRRFTGEKLVQSYAHWQDRFGASRHEVRDAVELLVQLGLVACQRATVIDTRGKRYPNRMVFEPVVEAISRITLPAEDAPHRTPNLPPEFTIETAEEGAKGGKKRPSEEPVPAPLLAIEDGEGVPTTAEGCAHQGIPLTVQSRWVPESESTHDSDKDSDNARPRMHAREPSPTEILNAALKGKRTRASPRRAAPKPSAEKRKSPSDFRFREAGALVATWELYQTRQAEAENRDGAARLVKRATEWRWLFYRLLEAGVPAADIEWTLNRAWKLNYPLAWPARFDAAWHYLSDPAASLLPWRGALAHNPAIRALEEENERLRYKAEDTKAWQPPEGYVRADDLFADFEKDDGEESSAL